VKIFFAVFGALLLTVVVIWGCCWAAHISHEKKVIAAANETIDEIKNHDSSAESTDELERDVRDTEMALLAIQHARRSGSDPFWFVDGAND
jgi:hypothetical protein